MGLIPGQLSTLIPKIYESEQKPDRDKLAYVKLFHPVLNWEWYVLECDGKDQCFGLVKGSETELGYFSLRELEKTDWYGIGVERDNYFQPTQLQDLPIYNIERVAA